MIKRESKVGVVKIDTAGGMDACPFSFRYSARVQVSLVPENIGRTTIPCTSLADLADYPPDSGRLEQKTPSRDVF